MTGPVADGPVQDPAALKTWQRIRRYAVSPRMIAESTRRRLAGDWRGACAAARVDADIDLAGIARRFGAEHAARIGAELTGLAPDLLRWHLPRALGGRTSLATMGTLTLSPRLDRVAPGDPLLVLRLPTTVDGSQRLRLAVAAASDDAEGAEDWQDLPACFWDADAAADPARGLRAAYLGSPSRLPWLSPQGAPLPRTAEPAPAGDAGSDPAGHAERVSWLLAQGMAAEAFAAAGIDLAPAVEEDGQPVPLETFRSWPLHLAGLAAEARRLAAAYGVPRVLARIDWRNQVMIEGLDGERLQARLVPRRRDGQVRVISQPVLRRPPDLDLLWHRMITPDQLHPLVRAALLPGAGPAAPQPVTLTHLLDTEPVRVRCRGEWHRVQHSGGGLRPLDHTPEEVRREQMLRGLGGAVAGCFAVEQVWHGHEGRLPKRLRRQRLELMQHVLHGETEGVVELLDAGMDPWIRDGRGMSLLHLLRCLDFEVLLPRLLAHGLPVDLRDGDQRSPLHVAIGNGGGKELARALLEAGADPRLSDSNDMSVLEMIEWKFEDNDNDEYSFVRDYVRTGA